VTEQVIDVVQEAAIAEMTADVVTHCQTIAVIRDDTEYEIAGEALKLTKSLLAQVDDALGGIIKAAHAAHKAATTKRAELKAPIEAAEKHVRKLMGVYATRKADEERRARIEAERVLTAEQERVATEAEAAGGDVFAVAEAVDSVAAVPVAATGAPKVKNVSMRRVPDSPKIAAYVEEHHDQDPISGVRVWCDWRWEVVNTKLLPDSYTKLIPAVRG